MHDACRDLEPCSSAGEIRKPEPRLNVRTILGAFTPEWRTSRGRWLMIVGAVVGLITPLSLSASAGGTQVTTSSSWAGLALTNPRVNAVDSAWTVPTVYCQGNLGKSAAAVWAGLGGYSPASNPEKLYQAGTISSCNGGKASYAAFQQTYQAGADAVTAKSIKDVVRPGDVIGLTVAAHSLYVRYSMIDYRNKKKMWSSSSIWTVFHPHSHSGECIVEAPLKLSPGKASAASLARFKSTQFAECEIQNSSAVSTLPTPRSGQGWNSTLLSMKSGHGIVASATLRHSALRDVGAAESV